MERDESKYYPKTTSSPVSKPTSILTDVSDVNTSEEASTISKSDSRFTRSRTYSLDLLSRGKPRSFGQCSTSKPDSLINSISSKLAILSRNSERFQSNFVQTSRAHSLPCSPVLLPDRKRVCSSEREFSYTLTGTNSSSESSCSSGTELVHSRDSARRLIKNLVTIFKCTRSPPSSCKSPLSPVSTEFVNPVASPPQMASSHSSLTPELQSPTHVSPNPSLVNDPNTDSLSVPITLASGSEVQCTNYSNNLELVGHNCAPLESAVSETLAAKGYLESDLAKPVSEPEPVTEPMLACTEADDLVNRESTNSKSLQDDCSLDLLLQNGDTSSFIPNDKATESVFPDGKSANDFVEYPQINSTSYDEPPETTSLSIDTSFPPPNSFPFATCDQTSLISDITSSQTFLYRNADHHADENTHTNSINQSNSTECSKQPVQLEKTSSPILTMASKRRVKLVETQVDDQAQSGPVDTLSALPVSLPLSECVDIEATPTCCNEIEPGEHPSAPNDDVRQLDEGQRSIERPRRVQKSDRGWWRVMSRRKTRGGERGEKASIARRLVAKSKAASLQRTLSKRVTEDCNESQKRQQSRSPIETRRSVTALKSKEQQVKRGSSKQKGVSDEDEQNEHSPPRKRRRDHSLPERPEPAKQVKPTAPKGNFLASILTDIPEVDICPLSAHKATSRQSNSHKLRKHQIPRVSLSTGKKESVRDKSPIVIKSRMDDSVAESPLSNKNPTVSPGSAQRSHCDIDVQLRTSESSNSMSTRDRSPELEYQQNIAMSRQSPKTSHGTVTSKKHVQELNMLKISTSPDPEVFKNPSNKNDQRDHENYPTKETNHHKLLMRWEKDMALGSKARTAPMLYALERMPKELAALKGPWIRKAQFVRSIWRHNLDPEVKQQYLERARENRRNKQTKQVQLVPSPSQSPVPVRSQPHGSSRTLKSITGEVTKLVVTKAAAYYTKDRGEYLTPMYIQVNTGATGNQLLQDSPFVQNVCNEVDKEIQGLEKTLVGTAKLTPLPSCVETQNAKADSSCVLSENITPQNDLSVASNSGATLSSLPTQRANTLYANSTINPSYRQVEHSMMFSEQPSLSQFHSSVGPNVPSINAVSRSSSHDREMPSGTPLAASVHTRYPRKNDSSVTLGEYASEVHSDKGATIGLPAPSKWTGCSIVSSNIVNSLRAISPDGATSQVTSMSPATCSLVTIKVSSQNNSTFHQQQTRADSDQLSSSSSLPNSPSKRTRSDTQSKQLSATYRTSKTKKVMSRTRGSLGKTFLSKNNSPYDKRNGSKTKRFKAPTKQGLSSRLSPQVHLKSPSFVIPQLPFEPEPQERVVQAPVPLSWPHTSPQTLGLNPCSSSEARNGQKFHQYVSPCLLGIHAHSWPQFSTFTPKSIPSMTTWNTMHNKRIGSDSDSVDVNDLQDELLSSSSLDDSSTASSQITRSISSSPFHLRNEQVSQISAPGIPSITTSVTKEFSRHSIFKNDITSNSIQDHMSTSVNQGHSRSSSGNLVVPPALDLSGLESYYSYKYRMKILKKIRELNQVKNSSELEHSRLDSVSSYSSKSGQLMDGQVGQEGDTNLNPIVVQPAVMFNADRQVNSRSVTSPTVVDVEGVLTSKRALKSSANSPEHLTSPSLKSGCSSVPSLMVNAGYFGDFSSMSLWEMEQLYAYNKAALDQQKQLTELIQKQLLKMQQKEMVNKNRKLSHSDLYTRFLRFLVEPKCFPTYESFGREPLTVRETDIIEGGTFDKPCLNKKYDIYNPMQA